MTSDINLNRKIFLMTILGSFTVAVIGASMLIDGRTILWTIGGLALMISSTFLFSWGHGLVNHDFPKDPQTTLDEWEEE